MTVYIEVEVHSNCVKRAAVETFIRQKSLKGAATDMTNFARRKFSRSLVHKKIFNLI